MTTLEAIKRDNISLGTYMELQRRFTRDKVETYSDLILGLPGETYESFVKGVDQLIENGQHNRIQFNNLSILPNAEMGDPAYQAQVRHGHGRVQDHQHPRRAHRARRRRAGSPGPRRRDGRHAGSPTGAARASSAG